MADSFGNKSKDEQFDAVTSNYYAGVAAHVERQDRRDAEGARAPAAPVQKESVTPEASVPQEVKPLHIRDDEHYARVKAVLPKLPRGSEQFKTAFAAAKEYSAEKFRVEDFQQTLDLSPGEGVQVNPVATDEIVAMSAVAGYPVAVHGAEMPTQENPSEALEYSNAAANGYDVHTGAPSGLRLRMGLLGDNPAAAAQYLEGAVDIQLAKQGIELPLNTPSVFRDESTGKLAYLRAYTDEEGTTRLKPTLVNGYGVEGGDVAENAPGFVDVAAESLAEMGAAGITAAYSKSPAATIAAGAGAAGFANYWGTQARVGLATRLGVPKDIAEKATESEWADTLQAAGYSASVPIAFGALRATRNLFRPLDPKDADAIKAFEKQLDESAASIRELEERTGVKFKTQIGELTGDPELLVEQAASQRRVMGRASKEHSVDEVHNKLASADVVRRINGQVVPKSQHMISPEKVAERTQRIVREPINAVEHTLKESQDALTDTVTKADALYNQETYRGLQADISEIQAVAKGREEVYWDNFRNVVEVSNRTGRSDVHLMNGPQSPIRAIINQKGFDSAGALSKSLKDAGDSFIKDLGAVDPRALRGQASGDYLMQETLDMRQMHKLLSHLKHQKRQVDANVSTTGWKGTDIGDVIGAIETQINKGKYFQKSTGNVLGKGRADEIRVAFKEANEATVFRHGIDDEATIKEILATKDGEFLLQPSNIRSLLFKANDARQLADVRRVFGNDVTKDAVMAKELEHVYRSRVFKDGKFTRSGHEAFMNEYRDHMSMLFGKEGSELITNAGSLADQVAKLDNTARNQRRAMEATFGKRLADEKVYAGNVARDALRGEYSPTQIEALQRRLKNVEGGEELWVNIQRNGLDAIEDDLLKNAGNEANSGMVGKILVDHEERLRALYGPQYVNDLKLVKDTMSILERGKSAAGIRRDVQPSWLAISRTLFGPLSATQRRITAVNRLTRKRRDALHAKLLSDPKYLRTMIKAGKRSPKDMFRIQALSNIPEAMLTPEDLDARMNQNVDPRWGPIGR